MPFGFLCIPTWVLCALYDFCNSSHVIQFSVALFLSGVERQKKKFFNFNFELIASIKFMWQENKIAHNTDANNKQM